MVYRYKECVFFSICRLKTPQIPRLPFKPAVIHVKVPNMITCTAMAPTCPGDRGFNRVMYYMGSKCSAYSMTALRDQSEFKVEGGGGKGGMRRNEIFRNKN